MASMMRSTCKSTMAVAALLVLAACASSVGAAVPSVRVVDVMFENQLTENLTVTIGALPFGTPNSITLAPGAMGQLALDVAADILVRDILEFRVNNTLYIDPASGTTGALGRSLAALGVLKIVVSPGPCVSGKAGLTLMDYAAGALFNKAGCAERQ